MIVMTIKEMNIWPDMFVCEVATLMKVIRENHYKENALNLSYLTELVLILSMHADRCRKITMSEHYRCHC